MSRDAAGWDDVYWRAFLDASPDVLLVVDPDGTILYVNRIAPALADAGIVGKKLWEFATGPDPTERLEARLREIVTTQKAIVYEHPGTRVEGGVGWYEVRAVPVVVEGKVARILWGATDITARKRLEDELRQAQKMEAIGLLAGGVAHDFNNILGVILGWSDLALRTLPPGHTVSEALQEIAQAAQRGGDLTRRLLAFSRKQIIKPRLLDIGAMTVDFAQMMRRILGEDVEIVVHAPAAPVAVQADAVQLEQVLMNLCTNARQAMPRGGELHITTRTVDVDDAFVKRSPWARLGLFAEVAVRDTGTGMDRVTVERAFEPFFTTKQDGTGLGLSTVHGIVEQHGGFLHIDSAPGQGATVRAFFPREDGGYCAPRAPAAVPSAAAFHGREVILLAEDEASLRALVTRTLSDFGYRVIAVEDGEQAVLEFERRGGEIDLALLDVLLPRLDARQVYERMRAIRPGVKVLFTTGYAPASTRLAELLAGSDVPLLEKPFTTTALAASVRHALDGAAPLAITSR